MVKFECNACGGRLNETGKFLICENCGTKYLLGRDDEGQPFTYQPVDKKDIECGQMAIKATTIEVSEVTVREIKLKDNINVDIHNESLNLDVNESIRLAETYIKSSEWDAAQGQINRLLITDNHCAEAQWYSLMCNKKIADEKVFISTWLNFSGADKLKIDDILANSSPKFARHITDLMFESAYAKDSMCSLIFESILPYAKNDVVYTPNELKEKISFAFDKVISKVYEKSFMYLLTHTLESDEIDKYIDYLNKFADNSDPQSSQKYYQMIIDVDPGNLDIRKKLVKADIDSNTDKEKCIADFEGLLKYSKNADKETYAIITYLNSEKTTTTNKSKFFWDLLGYHSKSPDGLKKEILQFAFILLNSSLWGEARNYLNLVLSIDSRNADAFWGLCLAKIQAKNEHEIIFKKDNLIECPEFHKSLALYQADKNDARVSILMSYTKKQKNIKNAKKLVIKIAAVFVAIVALIFVVNKISYARKYSVNNVAISVVNKEDSNNSAYYDNYLTELTLEIKNKSSQEIREVKGEMKIFNSNDEELLSATTSLGLDVEAGKTVKTILEIDSSVSDNLEEICSLDLENLKITFKITSIIFENYHQKEYDNTNHKVIKKITIPKSYKEEKTNKLKEQYNKAMNEYEKVDITSSSFQNDITEAVSLLDDIWEDVLKSDELVDDLYGKALEYKTNEEYEKAYFLFELLSHSNYKDSDEQALDCYDLASNRENVY